MTTTCKPEEVYKALESGRFGCAVGKCKEERDSKEQIVIHAAIVHGIRPAKNLVDGGSES